MSKSSVLCLKAAYCVLRGVSDVLEGVDSKNFSLPPLTCSNPPFLYVSHAPTDVAH